jgi:hypothetical protein
VWTGRRRLLFLPFSNYNLGNGRRKLFLTSKSKALLSGLDKGVRDTIVGYSLMELMPIV